MSWLMGCVGPDPAAISRTRSLARQAPGFLFETEWPAGYVAAGGIPETSLRGPTWMVVGAGLHSTASTVRRLDTADWQQRLSAPDPALADLDGHFIALRWDTSDPAGALSAFTDALGLRTLYHADVGSSLYLASRLDAIGALTGRQTLDDAAFGAHWLLINQLSQHALLAGVDRLGAGGRLHWKAGARQVTQHPWSPAITSPDPTAFEHRLMSLVLPEDPPGRTLTLGLSGGLDSRLLLAMRSGKHSVHLHTFGDANHRDAAMAQQLAGALSVSIDVIPPLFPDPDTCFRVLREHMATTHAVSPASSVFGLQSFGTLHARGRWMIDGGFGEIARQQYLNRLRLRGRDAVSRRDATRIAPFLWLHRVDVFSEDLRGTGLDCRWSHGAKEFSVTIVFHKSQIREKEVWIMGGESSIKKKRFDGSEVEILGETYEAGSPGQGDKYNWQDRIGDKQEMLKFLQSGLRYWYSKEGFGSEKRKTPA